MAHHDKVSLANTSGGINLIEHDKRGERPPKNRSNKDIDPGRSRLNRDYSRVRMEPARAWRYACEYAQAHSSRKMRDNTVVLAEDIIHLPRNWGELYPDEPPSVFFERVALPFLRARYGREGGANEVSAVVHYDEGGAPHVHYKSVPITEDGRLSHKDVYTRTELKRLHPELAAFAGERGFPGLDLYSDERARAREAVLTMPEYKAAMREMDAQVAKAREERDRAAREAAAAKAEADEAAMDALEARRDAAEARAGLAAAAEERALLEAECARLEEENELLEGQVARAHDALARIVDALADVLACASVKLGVRDYAQGVIENLEAILDDVEAWYEKREQARAAIDAARVERRVGLFGTKRERSIDTERGFAAAVDKARWQIADLEAHLEAVKARHERWEADRRGPGKGPRRGGGER